MSEWKEYKLNNFCKVGSSKRIFSSEYVPFGIPFFRSKEIIEKSFGESINELLFISEERFREIDSKLGSPKEGDILISSVGARSGIPYLVKKEDGKFYFKDGNLIWIKDFSENLDSNFLLYWFKSNIGQDSFESITIGSAQPALTIDGISNLCIKLPDIKTQKIIANILSCLDNKIDNLRRQNETLEKIAQTLFKHWFIDFEFPNNDGKPYKSSGGVMVASELGDIPAGWTTKPLDEIADFLNGLALQKYPPDNENNFLPVIKIKELRTGVTNATDRASTNIPEKYIIDNGDIIFSWSGSLDVVIWNFGKGALNQHLFKVNSHNYPKWLYYYWTLNHLQSFQHIAKSKATTMGHIQRKHLTEALCNVPNDNFLEKASEVFSPILQKIINNAQQIQTLTKTRDALLPKLMSGQLRVKD